MVKRYKVTYFAQYIDDQGCIRENHGTLKVKEEDIVWWEQAREGKRSGGDYTRTLSITEVQE